MCAEISQSVARFGPGGEELLRKKAKWEEKESAEKLPSLPW